MAIPKDSSPEQGPATWIFDVDGCLVDSLLGTSLRPGADALLAHLAAAQREVVLWSAGGADYAEARAQRFGLTSSVTRFEVKDGRDRDGRYETAHLNIDLEHSIFIDDRPEDMPLSADVVAVTPYLIENPRDRGLAVVAGRAGLTLSLQERPES